MPASAGENFLIFCFKMGNFDPYQLLLGKFKFIIFSLKSEPFFAASPKNFILSTIKYAGGSRRKFFDFWFQNGQFWPLPDFFCLESSNLEFFVKKVSHFLGHLPLKINIDYNKLCRRQPAKIFLFFVSKCAISTPTRLLLLRKLKFLEGQGPNF